MRSRCILVLSLLLLIPAFLRAQEEFRLTGTHIRLMRHAVVVWDASESGGPVLALYGDDQKNPLAGVAEVAGMKDGELPEEERMAALEKLAKEMGPALEVFLSCGELEPGTYTYSNGWFRVFGHREWPRSANDRKTIHVPAEDPARFLLLPEHLALLRHASAGWLRYADVPGIDSKRPYGDMTCFYLDMAEILKIKRTHPSARWCEEMFSRKDRRRMDDLHYSMGFALQVFLQHARIVPGLYRRDPASPEAGAFRLVTPQIPSEGSSAPGAVPAR